MEQSRKKTVSRGLCVLLAAVMALLAACETVPEDTTSPTGTKDPTQTDVQTAGETTKEPDEMVPVTDILTMPRIKAVSGLEYITSNLNLILKNGYGSESLNADAFAEVKDKLLIFRASTIDTRTSVGVLKMFRLGEEKAMNTSALLVEDGAFISVNDICTFIGGTYTYSENESGSVCELHINGKTVYCSGSTGFVSEGAAANTNSETQIQVLRMSCPIGEVKQSLYFLRPSDIADLTGLTVYVTDSGLILFSCGRAFDPVKGYYIAEEAEKLFLKESDLAEFSASEFIDIPNIFRYSDKNTTVYSFPELDLHANVTAYALQGVTAAVNLGPAIVAGQGEDASNFTVVRVFDCYGTVHTQFCAYPASVTGGVQVACAAGADSFNILTAPFTDKNVKELIVYDANGSYKFRISPSGSAPYAISAGAFLDASSDCYAVTSMYGTDAKVIEYFSAQDGKKLGETKTEMTSSAQTLLSANHDTSGIEGVIVCFLEDTTKAYEVKSNNAVKIEIGDGNYNGVFSSVFGGYIGTNDSTDEYEAFSTISEYKDGVTTVVDAGHRENMFFSNWAAKTQDTYVTQGTFWHTRMEFQSPVMGKISNGKTSAIRSNDISLFNNGLASGENTAYNTQYNMWEPCATHRWNKTSQMGALIDYIDPSTGTYAYATLNRNGERYDYSELASSFYNATYAPNIPALDRLHYWTLRTYLNKLAKYYKQAPENTVAVSPVHEHEIDTGASSVGDYNPNMISGFKGYMLELYGSIENINKVSGTDFKTEADFDAPRGTRRVAWDTYSTKRVKNEFFTHWALYNRYIVSERVIESYREALLAGFPIELIKAHQIPEGDAVAGLLGEADTRLSPVDIVLSCGTGYGGTRYGVWYSSKTSFFALAHNAGHNNITIGEYSSMTGSKSTAYTQLKYIFDNGGVFLHTMVWEGNVDGGAQMDDSERYAIEKLQKLNEPRSSSSGGVGDAHEYTNGTVSYNIVEIGSKEDSTGLLKSIKSDGTFEGSVYLQPFHALVTPIDIVRDGKASGTGKLQYSLTGKLNAKSKEITGINYNDTFDLRVTAKPTSGTGKLTFKVMQNGYEIETLRVEYTVTSESEYRFCFVNQLYLSNCTVVMEYENVEATDIDGTFMYEHNARKYYNEVNPIAHKGGVSFDILY